jgi:hypothetical protein
MGRRYQEVVLRCLRGDFGDFDGTVEEKEIEVLERFNTEVIIYSRILLGQNDPS